MGEPNSGFETVRRCCAAALRGAAGLIVPEADFAVCGLALAERHRVVPLVAAGLSIEARERFRRRVLALAQQTIRLEQELAFLSGILSAAGVEFLVLKGPALARQGYPVPDLRVYDDLDLWIESRDLEAAVRALEADGYRRLEPLRARAAACAWRAGIEVALRHPGRERLIEVAHGWRTLAPTRRAADEIIAAATVLEIAGAQVRAPGPVHALIFACLHGAHHRWDRFSWVADVAGLWLRLSPAERENACAVARRWRVEAMLGLGLRLASEHLGLVLEGRAAALAGAPRVEALFRRVRLEEIGPADARVPMLERLRFERDAQDSALRRLRTMAGWIFTPTLGDIEAVPLPGALYPLYAAIRPLRLLRHPWLRDWQKLAGRN
jgi:hypothetical protein